MCLIKSCISNPILQGQLKAIQWKFANESMIEIFVSAVCDVISGITKFSWISPTNNALSMLTFSAKAFFTPVIHKAELFASCISTSLTAPYDSSVNFNTMIHNMQNSFQHYLNALTLNQYCVISQYLKY